MAWRYIAQRMDDDGAGEFLDFDLPLTNVQVTDTLSGPGALTATVSPKIARLIADDGQPLLNEWGTAIWAESDGEVRGGGILTHGSYDGPSWNLECTGVTGYPQGMPFVSNSSKSFAETDPLTIVRYIWDHLQSQPGGNLGVIVSELGSPVSIGISMDQEEFDTESGLKDLVAGNLVLAEWETPDLGEVIDTLASDTPFDYHERSVWVGDQLKHYVDLAYPSFGVRRDNLRFVYGENIAVQPSIENDGANYASETLVLGNGEGRTMIRGHASTKTGRLRRVAVVTQPAAKTAARANSFARSELALRKSIEDISTVIVSNHPNAPVGSYQVGDEILLQGPLDWHELSMWVRILSITVTPEAGDAVTLSVTRSDRLAG